MLINKLVELSAKGFKLAVEFEPMDESYMFWISKPYFARAFSKVYRYELLHLNEQQMDELFTKAVEQAEKQWNDFYKENKHE